MPELSVLREKAEIFERRAERAIDPISKRHYQEMAAHYRRLLVEHLDTEAKARFFCIGWSVQVVVGSEAQIQSAAVRFQREQRLCTSCMYKHKKGTEQTE